MANRAVPIQGKEKLELPIITGLLTGLSKNFSTKENLSGNDVDEIGYMIQVIIDKTGTAGTINASVAYTDIVGAPGTGTLTRQYLHTREGLNDSTARDFADLALRHYKREKVAPVVYVQASASRDVLTLTVDEDCYNQVAQVKVGTQAKSFMDNDDDKLTIIMAAHSILGIYTALPSVIATSSLIRIIPIVRMLIGRNPTRDKLAREFVGGMKSIGDQLIPFRQHFMDNPVAKTPDAAGTFSIRIDEQREHPRENLHIENMLVRCTQLATLNADPTDPDTKLIRLVGRKKVGDAIAHTLFEVNGFVIRTRLLNHGHIVTDALYFDWSTGTDGEYGLPAFDPETGKAYAGGLYFEGYNTLQGEYEIYSDQNCLSEQPE